jgi:hypothetical protein
MSDADWVEAGSMAADLIGGIASFWPGYGTLAGAITGVGSTIGYAVADSKRGASGWDIAKNVGSNLGLSALSIIPFGVGKSGKAASLATKFPRLMKPIQIGLIGMGYRDAANTLVKVSEIMTDTTGTRSINEISMQDLKQLVNGLRAFSGSTKLRA